MRPLEGVLVVSVEQAVAVPLASRHLADLGARVVKVERPDGGDFARRYDTAVRGLASHFVWLNRGKESVAVDLKVPGGADVLGRLLERADVFLHNLGHGAVERLGFGAAALRERHPRLVTCQVSGYGATGPYAPRAAYDLLVQSEAALVTLTGSPEAPAKAGVAVADIAAGMYALTNVLGALIRRGVTGEGAALDLSMLEALAEWVGHPLLLSQETGAVPPRSGLGHPVICPYDAYPTADGARLVVGVQNDREWVRLARDVLRRPDLADDPGLETNVARVARRGEVDAAVGEALGRLTLAEATEALDAARIAHARLNTTVDLAAHPQLAARDRWREAATPVGPVRVLRSPLEPGGEAPTGPVPGLGEHTDAVLAELGYGPSEVARLRESAVVA